MVSQHLDFPVFDCDNHMYETTDALVRYLPQEAKGVIDYVEVGGRTKIRVRGKVSEFIPNHTFSVVAAPGAQEEYFRNGNPEGKSFREIVGKPIACDPAFQGPVARLARMDELGVDRALIYPTLAALVEERFSDDPNLSHVVIHAFNRWVDEHWSFNYKDRLFATPIITLPIVERAIDELHWVLERGAKVILIRPAPVPGFQGHRSFALPEFDPFWREVVDTGVLVVMHASDTGFVQYLNRWEGNRGEFEAFRPSAFRAVVQAHREIEDAVSSLCCHGLLDRVPDLRIALVENGSNWVAPLLDQMADAYRKMPQEFAGDPVAAFKRNIYVHPFHEEDPLALVQLLGADHILFGSDYPHPEGLAEPLSFVGELAGLSQDDVELIMGRNLDRLMGFV
jgi:predicted TIM-barrel fold metal-dependent hydrolase